MPKIIIEPNHPNFKEPFQELGSIGIDCFVAEIRHEDRCIVYDLGFKASPPKGYYLELVPRSSILKRDLVMPNSPGIIDPNYRENLLFKCKPALGVISWKNEFTPILIKDHYKADYYNVGDKCCQLILRKIEKPEIEVGKLPEPDYYRHGGFGSTGR